MSATQKFIRYAFGLAGTRAAVPDPVQADGSVSWQDGYGLDYQRQKTDPLAKNIERDKMNGLFYDLSLGLRQYQLWGSPEFVPAADNGGVAISYSEGARVVYTDGLVYESLEGANTALPTDATKWRPLRGASPAQFDDSLKYATTAFLRRRGHEFRSQNVLQVSQTLGAAHYGARNTVDTNGITLTLPAANSVPVGTALNIAAISSAVSFTVQRNGTDTLEPNQTSQVITGPADVTFVSDGLSVWLRVADTSNAGFNLRNVSSRANPGYQRLPSGVILQFGNGQAGAAGAGFSNTYPLAFPTQTLAVIAQHIGTDSAVNIITRATSATAVELGSNFSGSNVTVSYIAIGH